MINPVKLNEVPKNLLYALDIGTRSVVGTIAKKEGNDYVVVDYEIMAHPDRAMFDGQIHDIAKVTEVVRHVTDQLEQRNGFKLERAAIAAAGRALKTERASVERELDFTKEIKKTLTDSIEMEAIQQAQKILVNEHQVQSNYYCVGYSVINYYLDQSLILNPIGHRGANIRVEIIATFLPHIVVDSLYSVIHKAGLEVMNLTLEPIAAINVAIPTNLRLLNLALVDVGAGTSDIAISKEGTVTSYGMVSLAGDEITEKLAQTYLLDFNKAEALKIRLATNDRNAFTDVLGMSHEKNTDEIMAHLNETVDHITKEIAENIIQLNKKPPSAVFCIGGGSQIPGFTESLSQALGLPKERVVIKTCDALEKVKFEKEPLIGPEFITPIGIGITAFEEREHDFIQVNVNDSALRLFNSKQLQVSDALILAGFNARSLIAERGPSLTVSVDGMPKVIKGEYGEPAQIYINGVLSSLDSKINHKDQINVIPVAKGTVRVVTLEEVINFDMSITLNGESIKIVDAVSVNGSYRTGEYVLCEGDVIETTGIDTIKALAKQTELDIRRVAFFKGDQNLSLEYSLQSGDQIDFKIVEQFDYEIEADIVESSDGFEHAFVEGQEVLTQADLILERKSVSAAGPIQVTVNGELVWIPQKNKETVFVDIFDHIDFDITRAKGILVLKLNGERARYTDILKHGDMIDINWR
ncbi:cell division FtsA domain-containing protein [Fusibacter sp. 3D3]|uniref:cell division FtsA domain-containing protein n=1 Tax=Fusibacter sp. 3D3 TaxID=1048380 RepID=UPI000853B923|nr:cell division FtsA domain-containing protein [Fusibacter sp. 3D3]GAU77670.1 cell division protein FtsA [Fusibacter sp. 3D3]